MRRAEGLLGFMGRQERAGGVLGVVEKAGARHLWALETGGLECRRGEGNSMGSGERRRYKEEHRRRRRLSGL